MDTALAQSYCLGLLRAARAWRRLADAAAVNFELSEATAYPLVFINHLGEGVRQAALAEAIGIEGPSLVRLLDQLCAAGLVERRDHPGDRRAKALHLTARGRTIASALVERLDETRRQVLAGLEAEDLRTGLRVFSAIEEAASAGTVGSTP